MDGHFLEQMSFNCVFISRSTSMTTICGSAIFFRTALHCSEQIHWWLLCQELKITFQLLMKRYARICYRQMNFRLLGFCDGLFWFLKLNLFRLRRQHSVSETWCKSSKSILNQAIWKKKVTRWKHSYWSNRANSTKSDNRRRRRAYKRTSTKAWRKRNILLRLII